MGEYTGELVPGDKEAALVQTQYHFEIPIGRMAREGRSKALKRNIGTQTGNSDDPANNAEGIASDAESPKSDQGSAENGTESADAEAAKETRQTICWLDANRRGSIFQFMNHSCDPNARVSPGRCGVHNRVLYVYSTRPILRGEQITISYGDHWYSTPDEPCLCKSSKCKNPPKEVEENEKNEEGDDAGKRNNKNSKETGTKAETETKKRTAKGKTGQATNDLNDEVMEDAAESKTNTHPNSEQVDKPEKESDIASEPSQTRKRGRLRRGQKPSQRTPPT